MMVLLQMLVGLALTVAFAQLLVAVRVDREVFGIPNWPGRGIKRGPKFRIG